MPWLAAPPALFANVTAVSALVLMMLGVGLGVGPRLASVHRELDQKTLLAQLALNLLVVPVVVALALSAFGPPRDVAIAVLLLACLPAGPISLLFVHQGRDQLPRSMATVLAVQAGSVLVSPPLLLGLGQLVLGEPLVAAPRAAALSMGAQILLLETLPIVVGALLAPRLGARVDRVRAVLRKVTMGLLVGSALTFSSLYAGHLGEFVWLAFAASLVLLLASWVFSIALRGRVSWHDTAQIAGLRNISLSIVIAGTTKGLESSVVFVLIGAGVITVAAPLLRSFSTTGPASPDNEEAISSAR